MTSHAADKAPAPRTRRLVWSLLAATAVLAGLALLFGDFTDERKALQALPAAERTALYERTRESLQKTCAPSVMPKGLRAFCTSQAELFVQFEQCDAACRELAKPHLPEATR